MADPYGGMVPFRYPSAVPSEVMHPPYGGMVPFRFPSAVPVQQVPQPSSGAAEASVPQRNNNRSQQRSASPQQAVGSMSNRDYYNNPYARFSFGGNAANPYMNPMTADMLRSGPYVQEDPYGGPNKYRWQGTVTPQGNVTYRSATTDPRTGQTYITNFSTPLGERPPASPPRMISGVAVVPPRDQRLQTGLVGAQQGGSEQNSAGGQGSGMTPYNSQQVPGQFSFYTRQPQVHGDTTSAGYQDQRNQLAWVQRPDGRWQPRLGSDVMPHEWSRTSATPQFNRGQYMPNGDMADLYNRLPQEAQTGGRITYDRNTNTYKDARGRTLEPADIYNKLQRGIYRRDMNEKNDLWAKIRANRHAQNAGFANTEQMDLFREIALAQANRGHQPFINVQQGAPNQPARNGGGEAGFEPAMVAPGGISPEQAQALRQMHAQGSSPEELSDYMTGTLGMSQDQAARQLEMLYPGENRHPRYGGEEVPLGYYVDGRGRLRSRWFNFWGGTPADKAEYERRTPAGVRNAPEPLVPSNTGFGM